MSAEEFGGEERSLFYAFLFRKVSRCKKISRPVRFVESMHYFIHYLLINCPALTTPRIRYLFRYRVHTFSL